MNQRNHTSIVFSLFGITIVKEKGNKTKAERWEVPLGNNSFKETELEHRSKGKQISATDF